ncbi:uncharacterized protein [Penaeus vannamei]|uniref:uncharacterized protein isoform X1 n=1 Tax=Penaeus vannamei TaxID=6689 RepID=UPI00387F8C33
MPRKLRSTSSGDKPSVVRKHDDPTSTSQEAGESTSSPGGAPSSRSYSSEPGPSTSRQTDAARLRRGGALHFIMYQCENISVILINAGIFQ